MTPTLRKYGYYLTWLGAIISAAARQVPLTVALVLFAEFVLDHPKTDQW